MPKETAEKRKSQEEMQEEVQGINPRKRIRRQGNIMDFLTKKDAQTKPPIEPTVQPENMKETETVTTSSIEPTVQPEETRTRLMHKNKPRTKLPLIELTVHPEKVMKTKTIIETAVQLKKPRITSTCIELTVQPEKETKTKTIMETTVHPESEQNLE